MVRRRLTESRTEPLAEASIQHDSDRRRNQSLLRIDCDLGSSLVNNNLLSRPIFRLSSMMPSRLLSPTEEITLSSARHKQTNGILSMCAAMCLVALAKGRASAEERERKRESEREGERD